jgi:PhnB protein
MAVKPIPEGFHTVTPYLVTSNAGGVLDFIVRAFDAKVIEKMSREDGTVRHATAQIGDSMLMIADGSEKYASQPVSIYLYVEDTDALYRRGLEAGGTSLMEPADQFYGDRNAGVQDLAGNSWWIATHVEDVSEEEMARRAAEWMKKSAT